MKAFLPLILTILAASCSPGAKENPEDDPVAGYAEYSHYIPCMYVRLLGLKPYQEGFGLEPHALKNFQYRYSLMLGYDVQRLQENELKSFRESTGEKKGKFLDHDADGWGSILCNWLDGITVSSSAVFNGIPAGESLNSKVMLFSWSVWPSIKAGKDVGHSAADLYCKYLYFNPIPNFPSYSYISGQLDSLEGDDLYLIAADKDRAPAIFIFTEQPEIKQHVFTITYTEGDQRWSIDIPAVFD